MREYLEYSNEIENSNKFYDISLSENERIVYCQWGRIGSIGDNQAKVFENYKKAETWFFHQVISKIKKGYLVADPKDKKIVKKVTKKTKLVHKNQLKIPYKNFKL